VNPKTWIGIDPGPSSGIVVITWNGKQWTVLAFQCNADAVDPLLRWLFRQYAPDGVEVEQFDTVNRAGSKGKDADTTRVLVGLVQVLCQEHDVPLMRGRRCDVKQWGSDKRLTRIGFPMGPKFKDARDAGRYALYGSVRHGRSPDPLL
jgi:hypothetical protein